MIIMETVKDKQRLERYVNETAYRDVFPREMDEIAFLCRARAGEVLMEQGSKPHEFLFLVQGKCSVSCLLPNGKIILLKTLTAPSMIGEMELVSPDFSPLTVRALEDCELLVFSMTRSRSILLKDTAFLRKLCVLLGNKERQSVLRFFATSGYPLDKRLAAFILEQSDSGFFRVRKIRMAETLGVSYRHLETVLNHFIVEGYLSKDRFIYHIEDEEALRQLAGEMSDVLL